MIERVNIIYIVQQEMVDVNATLFLIFVFFAIYHFPVTVCYIIGYCIIGLVWFCSVVYYPIGTLVLTGCVYAYDLYRYFYRRENGNNNHWTAAEIKQLQWMTAPQKYYWNQQQFDDVQPDAPVFAPNAY